MVKTLSYKPRKRFSRSKKLATRNSPRLYPSLYDSMLMYFNYSQTFTDTAITQGAFYGAYFVESFQTLVNLRPYFSQYRVEKVTLRLMIAENPAFAQIHMATTHSADGATVGASTPTLQSIKQYRDWQVFAVNQNTPKKVWTMDTNDASETNYYDVPAAIVSANSQFVVGGVQFFTGLNAAGAGGAAVVAYVQFKVRLKGKQACTN